jgi:hypothetical protein
MSRSYTFYPPKRLRGVYRDSFTLLLQYEAVAINIDCDVHLGILLLIFGDISSSSSSSWLYSPVRTLTSPHFFLHSSRSLAAVVVFDLTVQSQAPVEVYSFYGAGLLVQRPTPNLEDQVSVFMTPGDRMAQLYPQALGTHFSRLLRHAWVTVGPFFNPGHHTGICR